MVTQPQNGIGIVNGLSSLNSLKYLSSIRWVSAHEFGHCILMYVGGINLSWGHKGSTNVLLQNVKASSLGYPNQGKIDLMKYYNNTKNTANLKQRITRSEALEVDIKRLIWSSEVLWKD